MRIYKVTALKIIIRVIAYNLFCKIFVEDAPQPMFIAIELLIWNPIYCQQSGRSNSLKLAELQVSQKENVDTFLCVSIGLFCNWTVISRRREELAKLINK